MSKFRLIKQFGALSPYDDISIGIVERMSKGQVIECDYSFPRNPGNHRRFFVFINLAFDMQEFFTNPTAFRKWLIITSGHCTIIIGPNGEQIFDPDSIAWDQMDEEEFREVFNDCIQAFIDNFGNKISREELNKIVEF